LPQKLDAKAPLWSVDFPGQSTPVIAGGRLYINGYQGDGQDLQEFTACFDAETGQELWRHGESDFLSDTIYLRYATSSPTVDPETGNIYAQHTQGLLMAFTPDGKLLWKHSMMEEFGRLTFPNSRTATASHRPGTGHHPRHHQRLGCPRCGRRPLLRLRQEDR
jgi:hypothetical protein